MEGAENLKRVPSSMEAEKSVLGGIFLKPDCFGDIIEIISPNDFYKVGHKYIFEAMIRVIKGDYSEIVGWGHCTAVPK